jgi:hypothetical protein
MTDEPRGEGAPTKEDERHDDHEYNPQLEPSSAKAWLNLLRESEKAFEDWNAHCDNIDERYASLKRLATKSREREFQMFWANIEVLKPSIYAKAPVPVVVPKFKDHRPLPLAASEFLERCSVVAFDLAKINELMLLVRDDVVLYSRGVPWVRYEKGDKDSYYDYEKVCIDHKNRRDFLHSLSRSWREVTWVAAASYLTRAQARKRFHPHSEDQYQEAEYKVDRDAQEVGGTDKRERAKFWEIWDKENKRVVWVAEGCEKILDEDDPHLQLEGFFPCPKPAYSTVQPGSLIPVPEAMQYEDQLDEINTYTGRIHALSEALTVKGFYPAGGGELAEAIETAIKINTPGVVMVPISNWAAFGGSKETIIWMPIEQIVATITQLIVVRKQVIEDIYQIIGLADIMRGSTDPAETLGAQELKTQYGSVRVRDKQAEMVRLAKDLVNVTGEVMTETFDDLTLVQMSQTMLPTVHMQEQQIKQLQQQLGQQKQQLEQALGAVQGPPQPGQQPPDPNQVKLLKDEGQKALDAGVRAIEKVKNEPNVEQVLKFIKDNRTKAFTLDIETDSTVLIDENGEKQRRGEFLQVLTGMLAQLGQMVTNTPESAEVAGALLKFATAPFRAGRALESSIDNLIDIMKDQQNKPKGDDPVTAQNKTALQIEQMKDATNKEKVQSEERVKRDEMKMRDAHERAKLASAERLKMAEINSRKGDDLAKMKESNLKIVHSREEHAADMEKIAAESRRDDQKAALAQTAVQNKMRADEQRANDQRAAQAFKLAQPPKGFPR